MDEEKNNVIQFPRQKVNNDSLPNTTEQLVDGITKVRETFADILSAEIASDVFGKCILAGFGNISETEHARDCILVVESIKSLLLKSIDHEYPLQEFANTAMAVFDDKFKYSDEDDYFD